MKKSLRIKGLEPRAPFQTMARLIVRDRLRRVHRETKNYLRHHDPESLHSLLTTIYRLRYPLECFVECFPRRLFNATLDQITLLERAVEQMTSLERMIDDLRTHQVSESSPTDLIEPGDAATQTVAMLTGTAVESRLAELEAERNHRLEAFDGVLKAVLQSEDFRAFRQLLRE